MMALIRRYANIERLKGTIIDAQGFAMANPAARPFPNSFNSHQGINQSLVGGIVVMNLLVACFSRQTNSLLYVNPATPGCMKRILGLFSDQANNEGNFFQMAVMMYNHLRTESRNEMSLDRHNTAENEELYIFFFNFIMEFTQPQAPPIMEAMVLNWARRCCGIIPDGCYLGAKLEYAVIEVMTEHCPNTMRRQFGNDIQAAMDQFPTHVMHLICQTADRYIKHRHGIPTWWFPNNQDIDASDFQEYIDDNALLHQSDVLVTPGWNDECTWVTNPQDYPLAPGDVNVLAATDTNPVDPQEYYLHGKDVNDNQVIQSSLVYLAYARLWNQDPLDVNAN